MLNRVRELASRDCDFAFETTMASRGFAPFLAQCRDRGYKVWIVYVWLDSPELAVSRVAARVRSGGIPCLRMW